MAVPPLEPPARDEEGRGPLPPGSVIGIVGCGQLGRMLACAAARLGFRVHTYGPEADPPAARVAERHHAAPYEDQEALAAFAAGVDAATYEFENVPPLTVRTLRAHVPVRPDDAVLAVCQDLPARARHPDRALRGARPPLGGARCPHGDRRGRHHEDPPLRL